MKRIKIVEDDEALREELSILLERNGFITVKEEPYDLVIMDVNLLLNARRVALRSLGQFPDPWVVCYK